MAIVLLVVGIVACVYTPWVQDLLREKVVEMLNKDGDTHIEIGSLRLKFPLRLSVGDVLMVQHGDTMVQAAKVEANVAVMPLIQGEIELKYADLQDARYQMGAMDSASCMVIRGHDIKVDKSYVKLSPMDIHVTAIDLDSASVDMFINPADTFPVTPPSEPTPLNIRVDRVDFRALKYEMQSMPAIWNLTAAIGSGSIDSVNVDVMQQTVNISRFEGTGLDAVYLMPNAQQLAETLVIVNPDKKPSPPWTIEIGTIDMLESKALYTASGLKPLPGLDFGYIQVDNLDLLVRNFYNRATVIELPFNISGKERCGIDLSAHGTLGIDSVGMKFSDFGLTTTTGTSLALDGYMSTVTPITNPNTPVRLTANGHIAVRDVTTMFPTFKSYFAGLRQGSLVYLDVAAEGTPGRLDIDKFNVRLDRHIRLSASGNVVNLLEPDRLAGNLKLHGDIVDISNWVGDLLAGTGVRIPVMTIDGDVRFGANDYSGNIALKTEGGSLGLGGFFHGNSERYDVDLKVNELPVNAFMPALGIGRVSGHVTAVGQGIDPMTGRIDTTVDADISLLEYNKTRYNDIHISADGSFSNREEKYDVDLSVTNMPVNAFMPDMGIGLVTADVKAEGRGYDPFSSTFATNTTIDVHSIEYEQQTYEDVRIVANASGGQADLCIDSFNPGLDLHLTAEGNLSGKRYDWMATLDSSVLNLSNFPFLNMDAVVSADLELHADMTPDLRDVDATLTVRDISYTSPDEELTLDNSKVILSMTDTLTNVSLQNRDFFAFFSTPMSLEAVMGHVDKVGVEFKRQLKNHDIKITELQEALMPFTLDIEAGTNNVLAEMLAAKDINFAGINILASNDSTLYLSTQVKDFEMGKYKLDDVNFDIRQEGQQLNYEASVNNKPGTLDEYAHVNVDGFVRNGEIGVNLLQKNIEQKTGFDVDLTLSISPDSIATLNFTNLDPIINYQQWHLNDNNFVSFDFRHHHLDADLMMKTDMSRVLVYTEHARSDEDGEHDEDEDLIVQLFDIQLQDWLAFNPYAPPVTGNVSAGMRLNWHDNALNGKGTVDVENLYYGKDKIGDFNIDLGLLTDINGLIKADASLWVNGTKTLTLSGVLNEKDTDSPFDLDLSMVHLPLSIANPFIPDLAKLSGSLNGELCISGETSQPLLNGYLTFEDAKVDVNMLGSTFTLNKDTIPMVESVVQFNKFRIMGSNENPLFINGNVDARELTNPKVSLDLSADNMQIVKSNRAKNGAEVYGNAFIGLKATAKGNLNVMNVDADVSVLAGTNVTYILAGGTQALENQEASNMVKFVNFADTAAVAAADSIQIKGTILNLVANLNVNTGSILNVEIGTNAQDKVQLQGSGNFTYTSSPVGDGRMVGRYTFSGGFLKYAPPLISNLNFNFTEGSYVAFSGDITNPQLNIKAVERMKANVSQAGQNSRLIYFDIILNVTGTPTNLDVAFNLETDDDVTVANELASMSPTQRASEAMNLLLYNTYTGGSTKATSNLNGNPLFSFLTNSVNSWLANNVRGVDLSIGVDQYDQTRNGNTSTTTAYSYQVSKSLLNDRLKIVVGGSYSDDPYENGNVAEDLINDVSVEYFLNDARTMYFRLFRHTGYESILEGEITQTGVGFVYRKRINRVSDMFINPWKRYRNRNKTADDAKDKEKTSEKTDSTTTSK